MEFQSTLPRGERRDRRKCKGKGRKHFNPRSREGSAGSFYERNLDNAYISIHAPARGATIPANGYLMQTDIFQSTLPRGERQIKIDKDITTENFNPRSREGSDFNFI